MRSEKAGTGLSRGGYRFESARLDSLYSVLDAVAWLDAPTSAEIAQFAGIDHRTAGKLLKNASHIGLIDKVGDGHVPAQPFPYKGSLEQKQAVVREALVRLPLLTSVRQFLRLGDKIEVALRKAATLARIVPFSAADLNPVVKWAQSLNALQPDLLAEDLVEAATSRKEKRHQSHQSRPVAFLSHSSTDKPFVRQLATDLAANDVEVWLDEHHIKVGDSIPEKIAQGLAASDYFLIAISEASVASEWVKKELNNALMNEVERRRVHVLPIRLDGAKMPQIISDKRYADFSKSYKDGLADLLKAMKD
jgi:hypothetical protein